MALLPQTIFDRTATHLLTQGAPAHDADGGCMYRSPQGLKCAVGALIPDDVYHSFDIDPMDRDVGDEYDNKLEGGGVTNAFVQEALVTAGVLAPKCDRDRDVSYELLRKIQVAHDTYGADSYPHARPPHTFKEHIRKQLRHIAAQFNLDASVLDA